MEKRVCLVSGSCSNSIGVSTFFFSTTDSPSFSPSHSTRTLRDVTRVPVFEDNPGGRPHESESYSSMLANPSVSPDYSRDGSRTGQLTIDVNNILLSLNYLPSDLSSGVLATGVRRGL